MAKRKTNDEFYQEVYSINPHIELSGTYKNGDSKIRCKCKKCGYEWITTARNLIYKKKCLRCFHNEQKFVYPDISHEEFCNIVKKKYPNISITGTYHKGLMLISYTCKKCGYHSRGRVQQFLDGTFQCKICDQGKEDIKYGINDIRSVNPVLYDCLKNKSDADKYTIHSRAKVDFICPSCGNIIRNKTIEKVNRMGLKCKCQDGNSLGEKYFYQIIKSVDENVEVEKYLECNYSYRYDFYGEIDGVKWICEIQGKQHKTKSFETCGGRTLDEEINNDVEKRNYALSLGIDYYIQIDSEESGLHQLKQKILNSDLCKIYDFSHVDWIECYRKSLMSDIYKVAEMWNNGCHVMQISSLMGLGKGTIRHYLIKANDIGICTYDHTRSNRIKVKCLDTGEIFDSLRDAERKYNIKRGYLSSYLKGNVTLPVGNKNWIYYDIDDKNIA